MARSISRQLEGARDPVASRRGPQQPTSGQSDDCADGNAIAQLLDDELSEARARTLLRCRRQGDEKQQEWHRQSVVQARLYIECLTHAQRCIRAGHHDLPKAGIGRRQDRGQNRCLPKGKARKDEAGRGGAKQDGERQANGEQARRQVANVPQQRQVGAAGVGEKQQDQADLGKVENETGA